MATQKSCSLRRKKSSIRESTRRVKDRAQQLIRTYLDIKMTPAGALMRLQESLALNQSRRFPAKRGRQTPLPFTSLIATLVKVNPESLASRKDDLRNKLISGLPIQAPPENRPLQQTSASYIQERPPLRTSGYTARWLVRAFEYGAARNRLRIVQPGPEGCFSHRCSSGCGFGFTIKFRRTKNADSNARD
jgi:hypothetical protein